MSHCSSITVSDLARRLEGDYDGDGSLAVRTVATLDQADGQSLSWVGTPELVTKASSSKAGVLLIPATCSAMPGRTVIRVSDPDAAICDVLEWLAPPLVTIDSGIHRTAVVEADAMVTGAAVGAHVFVGPGAVIGAGTQLHAGVYIGAGARIGSDCLLWPNVVIRERVSVGDRVCIHPNSTIGADGFGYIQRGGKNRKVPQIGTVVIEDDVEIGANSTIDRARTGVTRIGRGTKIDNLVQVGHNVDMGEDCIIIAGCAIAGSTSIGNRVMMSGQVGVTDHRRVGDDAMVAAKSLILRDVPDGQVTGGNPARALRRYLREQACVGKLPDSLKLLRSLERRLNDVESSRGGDA